jgi:8-oxo-dGTP diphosphatase
MPDIELAAAIVVHEGRVLLVRRSNSEHLWPGVWGVPCGKVERDESPPQAVLRELREETGLGGVVGSFAGRSEFSSNWRGRTVRNVQSNYIVYPEVDPTDIDSDNMPIVRPPKKDQASEWVEAGKVHTVIGLDEHNLTTIRQGLAALTTDQGAGSAKTFSNCNR